MAEAEDVLSDVARHATIQAQALWRRRRYDPHAAPVVKLADVATRLDLLIEAVFGVAYALRVAQPPARRAFLRRWFRRHDLPPPRRAVPATNDCELWLPSDLGVSDYESAWVRFRLLALRQACRAQRGSAAVAATTLSVWERDLYGVLEAHAADTFLLEQLPGLLPDMQALAQDALARRPDTKTMHARYRPLEALLRACLQSRISRDDHHLVAQAAKCVRPEQTLALVRRVSPMLVEPHAQDDDWGEFAVLPDDWTGSYLAPGRDHGVDRRDGEPEHDVDATAPRSARLERRPVIRQPVDQEDDKEQGVWMIHSGAPTEHAEDPMGMQRPTDRDDQTPAEEFADSVSELAEARLVSTPQRARDVLISDDPPDARAKDLVNHPEDHGTAWQYPEWDYHVNGYRVPGSTVHILTPAMGPMSWVDETLERHRALLWAIQRQFERLRPSRTRLRRQREGQDLDIDACIEAFAERQAGLSLSQNLYQTDERGKRDTAIMLLIDISGSTDSWLSANQRIIDVEREALLLVCHALEAVGDAYAVLAFSGEGPHGVTIQSIKDYGEAYGQKVAQRIAALEPDRYTRTGAALRHASAMLMQQSAHHRLLLLLSDGKPNDADDYEGRYGVEDMRQAVNEARLQGIFPFCLTIDWQAANYLPAIFGAHQYALLPKSEHLPNILLDWTRKLLA